MRINQLEAITALAETGSIRGAARALGLSQSAVTRALKELERDTGAHLLDRQTEGTKFTRAGTVLLDHASLALAAIRRAKEEVRRISGQDTAQVRIAVTPAVANAKLARLVTAFQSDFPDGRLQIQTGVLSTVVPALRTGDLDFAMVLAKPEEIPPDLSFEQLSEMRMIPITRLTTDTCVKMSWEALAQKRWVANMMPGSADHIVFEWLNSRGIQFTHPLIECSSPYLKMILNVSTDVVALSPAPLYHSQLHALGLVAIAVPDLPPPIALGILLRDQMPQSEAAQMLLALARRLGGGMTL